MRRCLAALLLAGFLWADERLILQSAFVESVKNRATIDAQLEVDFFPKSPHSVKSGGDDGDIHMAGRSSQVGLPMVAEVMNAKGSPALDLLRKTTPGTVVPVSGVWRIWFEHPGTVDMVQFAKVGKPTSSNPDHVFEIHPLTQFGSIDILNSVANIEGYDGRRAPQAFQSYESTPCTIAAGKKSIAITGPSRGFNYVAFNIELVAQPKPVADAFLVLANVFETDSAEDPLTAKPIRMVFVKGTAAADAVKDLAAGDRLNVLGIPRVNLAEVSAIAGAAGAAGFTGNLPYEMIVVAVLP